MTRDNPTNYTDPTGADVSDCAWAGVAYGFASAGLIFSVLAAPATLGTSLIGYGIAVGSWAVATGVGLDVCREYGNWL